MGRIAQRLERSTHNAWVVGSSPTAPIHETSPCANWMLNSYSKHSELTEQDIKDYFDHKERVVNSMVE